MIRAFRFVLSAFVTVGLLCSGALLGIGHARRVEAQNKFGQPKTLLHVVMYKWKDGVSDADKQKALAGIKEMAAKIPGIKNVWLKANRMQLRDMSGAFVIEFTKEPDSRGLGLSCWPAITYRHSVTSRSVAGLTGLAGTETYVPRESSMPQQEDAYPIRFRASI